MTTNDIEIPWGELPPKQQEQLRLLNQTTVWDTMNHVCDACLVKYKNRVGVFETRPRPDEVDLVLLGSRRLDPLVHWRIARRPFKPEERDRYPQGLHGATEHQTSRLL